MAYELACHSDVQQRLYEEIIDTIADRKAEDLTYEELQSMKYLDQVISEGLRKWPASPMSDRICVKDFDLKYDGKVLKFRKDLNIIIFPIFCLHR